jgi:hypothetical protein
MNIYDLEHNNPMDICVNRYGGTIAETMLSMQLMDRDLTLDLGGNTIFETTLEQPPTGIQVSLGTTSGASIDASSVALGGTVRNLSIFAGQFNTEKGTIAVSSSSALAMR